VPQIVIFVNISTLSTKYPYAGRYVHESNIPYYHVRISMPCTQAVEETAHLRLLINPVKLSRLPLNNLVLLEPKGDLFLRVLDAIAAVADVTADIDGEVTTNGTWQGVFGVGGTEDGTAGLDGVTAFPDHGANGAGRHVYGRLLSVGAEMGDVACMEMRDGSNHVQETRPGKKGLLFKSS
jgi:hypothetical protein